MDWIVFGVQWAHVLLGILWFGTVLSLDVIVIPAINRLPIVAQRDLSAAIGARATPLFQVVVPAIIVLGIVRGTILGPITSVDALFGTAYGLTWLVALAATIGTYLFGLTVLVPAIRRMETAPLGPDGGAPPELAAATDRVKRLVGIELIGFLVIFTCMVLMRFGW
jgi:putative copper export protein